MLKAKSIITSLLEQQTTKNKSKINGKKPKTVSAQSILTHRRTGVQLQGRGKGRVNPPQGYREVKWK